MSYIHTLKLDDAWLDEMGHINHAYYLNLGEQARWAMAESKGIGKSHIQETGIGWVILEAQVFYLKELMPGDTVCISCQLIEFTRKIGKIHHDIKRGETLCAQVDVTFGFFHLTKRKLVTPNNTVRKALGIP